MRVPNFGKLSHAELVALRDAVEKELLEREKLGKRQLRERLVTLARAEGYNIDEVFKDEEPQNGSKDVRYRDPANPFNTWTGRGRMPLWLLEALKQGKRKEDFRVD